MAFANTYLRISTANYEALPVPQSFVDKRGPVYFPVVGLDDPIEMTSENAGIKQAYEAKYPNMRLSVIDNADGLEWGAEYEGSTHQILTLPNLSQTEIKAFLSNVPDASGFDDEAVILAHDEIRIYKSTGTLPAA
jgi:hypothetical protein